jgi:hypothetical protein
VIDIFKVLFVWHCAGASLLAIASRVAVDEGSEVRNTKKVWAIMLVMIPCVAAPIGVIQWITNWVTR